MITQFDDYNPEDRKKLQDACLDFLDWLNAERRKAQNIVRALYPKLKDGVPAQVIEREIENALYWKEIPDEWAVRYAEDYVDRQALYDGIGKFISKFQFFIDMQPEMQED